MSLAGKIRTLCKLFIDPSTRLSVFDKFHRLPDDEFLKRKFKNLFGRELDLNNPQTFNEKINWLKLYNRRAEYTDMIDKYAVKKIVSDKIGAEYVIPLIGVYEKFDDINFDALPNKFVLKCNHTSGGLTVCRDKSKLDIQKVKSEIEPALKQNYYWPKREWVYKNIKPKIIIEEYVQDGERLNLPVFKIFSFSGTPRVIQAIQDDKTIYETIDYFDTSWNKLPFRQNFPNSPTPYSKPEKLDLMLKLTSELSAGIPLVRVDWYTVNDRIYFSEFTFYSDAGFAKFEPEKWDYTLGSWIELPKEKITAD